MSFHDYLQFEHQHQHHHSFFDLSAGSINELDLLNLHSSRQVDEFNNAKLSRKRRDDTNDVVNKLYEQTLFRRAGERDVRRTGGRKNKNEILGLTNARLVKEKYLRGDQLSHDMEFVHGIQTAVNNGEFVLILRSDGRIVAMSDEVEQHLDKTMRSLYTQCTNIFECLDSSDAQKLRTVLDSADNLTKQEHRLVCTFRLPKGKRPSRAREDIKTISMAGHFYSCHSTGHERLFIARCEALVSRTTNGTSSSSSSSTVVNSTTIKVTLNDDMTVSLVSSNAKDILGYSRHEMIGNWFGRFLATNDLEKFERIRQTCFQADQQVPLNVCEILDIHTIHGENRLTFLCQIRPTRERRSKAIKYSFVCQLIDPTMRAEYRDYLQDKSESSALPIKVEQVNLVSPKASEDALMAHSPSLAMGLLMFDGRHTPDYVQQQHSPNFARTLSDVVAPYIFDAAAGSLLDFDYEPRAQRFDLDLYSLKPLNDTYLKYQLEQEIASIDALIDEY